MSLYNLRCIHRYKQKELPIEKYVIERVESLAAEAENQLITNQGYTSSEWASRELVDREADKDVHYTILIVDILGNADNVKNEVLDIIVADDDIEVEDNYNLIEEDEDEDLQNEEGLEKVEIDNVMSNEDGYMDDQEEDEQTLPEDHNDEQEQDIIAQIDDEVDE